MRYLFDDCLLDVARHELVRRDAVVPIEPQVFDLLVFLIQNRERVVSRDELQASVWEGRNVSDSTFTSRINAARSVLGDSGEEQRLIRTVPRRGYRFVGEVREEPGAAALPTAPADDGVPAPTLELPSTSLAPIPDRRFRLMSRLTIISLFATVVVGVAAAALLAWSWGFAPASRAAQRFDPSVVPFVSDDMRRSLIGYAQRPDAKALAIARDGWGVADRASSAENAEKEALRQCASRAKGVCRLYASGMEVVWSKDTLPLPAPGDLRSEPLEARLEAGDVPTVDRTGRDRLPGLHLNHPDHKALALGNRAYFWVNNRQSRQEAARLAIENCAEFYQRPCLLLAVDGFLTVRIPKSRRVERIFLPSIEGDIAPADRERIARIYQGAEWRALARGKTGTWHPFVAAPTEAAAVEGALTACQQGGDECRLYAIGNFRIADE